MPDRRGEPGNIGILHRGLVGRVAALHAEALPGDVLPSLGRHFLKEYYALVMDSQSQTVIGFSDGEDLIGFCQVSWRPIELGQFVLKRPSMLLDIAALALRDPRRFLRGVAASRYRPHGLEGVPDIAFIAVRPARQGEGVGRALVAEANRQAAQRGHSALMTKTSNELAAGMYQRHFSARVVGTRRIAGMRYHFLTWSVSG